MLFDPQWAPPTTEIKLEPWQEILLKAADILETQGWCQNATEHDGKFCAAGAIYHVVLNDRNQGATDMLGTYHAAVQPLETTLYKRYRHRSIPYWNDTCGRTKEEVIALIREVAHAV